MIDRETEIHIHPYSLSVGLVPRSETFFQWTIRKGGKMFQRSDRHYPSEDKALSAGKDMVERLLSDFGR